MALAGEDTNSKAADEVNRANFQLLQFANASQKERQPKPQTNEFSVPVAMFQWELVKREGRGVCALCTLCTLCTGIACATRKGKSSQYVTLQWFVQRAYICIYISVAGK